MVVATTNLSNEQRRSAEKLEWVILAFEDSSVVALESFLGYRQQNPHIDRDCTDCFSAMATFFERNWVQAPIPLV